MQPDFCFLFLKHTVFFFFLHAVYQTDTSDSDAAFDYFYLFLMRTSHIDDHSYPCIHMQVCACKYLHKISKLRRDVLVIEAFNRADVGADDGDLRSAVRSGSPEEVVIVVEQRLSECLHVSFRSRSWRFWRHGSA